MFFAYISVNWEKSLHYPFVNKGCKFTHLIFDFAVLGNVNPPVDTPNI